MRPSFHIPVPGSSTPVPMPNYAARAGYIVTSLRDVRSVYDDTLAIAFLFSLVYEQDAYPCNDEDADARVDGDRAVDREQLAAQHGSYHTPAAMIMMNVRTNKKSDTEEKATTYIRESAEAMPHAVPRTRQGSDQLICLATWDRKYPLCQRSRAST